MAYGDKRDYPKIDLYIRTSAGGRYSDKYVGSTTWARSLSEAKIKFRDNQFVAGRGRVSVNPDEYVVAYYAEPRKTRARRSR